MQVTRNPLSSLQNSYLTGIDVRDRLVALSRVPGFRELLDVFVTKLDALSDVGAEKNQSPTYRAALRYMPLVKLWRDLRFELDGRINHWVNLRHNIFYDADRGYPQLEIHLFSHSEQIFHMKDDVDDVLRMAVHLVELCSKTISRSQSLGQALDRELIEALLEDLTTLDRCIASIRQISESISIGK